MKWYLLAALVLPMMGSCSDEWDDHYEDTKIEVNNPALKEVEQTTEQFLSGDETFAQMYGFLGEQGIFSRLGEKGLLHTMLVVKDDAFSLEGIDTDNANELLQLANSHVSDIALPPSNLHDGDRVMMWHQKFVSVAVDTAKVSTDVSRISFGGSAVSEIIKTTDGYVYVIDKLIHTPKSLKDLIDGLDEENYSIFKQLVLASGGQEFDRANSKPIGVDATGNTIYDSVFIYTNEFFDAKNFDLSSESLTATALVFSDDVIHAAMADAEEKLGAWDMKDRNGDGQEWTEEDKDILRNWILEVAFFNQRLTPAEMSVDAASRLTSIYNRQWRTEVQKVDVENMEEVSNGVVYYVTDFKIPNNVLMYRLKDFYYYYENCDDIGKTKYFVATNLSGFSCNTDVAAWTPLEGVWPKVENRVLNCSVTDTSLDGWTLDFTLLKRISNEDGAYEVRPYTIPPGTYRLAMGFKQNLGLDLQIEVLVNGAPVAEAATISVGSATTYHYDRGATLSDGYPEGYAEVKDELTNSKKNNYNTDGGLVYEEITIPDVKGDGAPTEVVIRVKNSNLAGTTKTMFHHWCLRPTENNY
ncbi:MAG: hypothetical protein IJX44_02610 [Bacteroidaceae bacterium]|nr:hypothetical protein [Bacteroidaceae bacterium]